jgi:hypothetical protein
LPVGNEGNVHVTNDRNLSSEDFAHLVDWAGHLHEEATQCAEAGYWRAAFILCAASVEAGLAATALRFEPELRAEGLLKPKDSIARLSLGNLVGVGRKAGWLPAILDGSENASESLAGEVGDAVHFLIQLRTVAVHPTAHVRDLPWLDFANPMMADWFSICDGILAKVFEQLTSASAP